MKLKDTRFPPNCPFYSSQVPEADRFSMTWIVLGCVSISFSSWQTRTAQQIVDKSGEGYLTDGLLLFGHRIMMAKYR